MAARCAGLLARDATGAIRHRWSGASWIIELVSNNPRGATEALETGAAS